MNRRKFISSLASGVTDERNASILETLERANLKAALFVRGNESRQTAMDRLGL